MSPVDYERRVMDALTELARERRPAGAVTTAAVAARARVTVEMAEITLRKLRATRAVREHRQRGRLSWEVSR